MSTNFNEMTLADKCKWFEKNFSPETMIPLLPVVIRIDGVNFSSYTKNFTKPYDIGFSHLMEALTKELVDETNAIIGYTQSDEITLILYSNSMDSSIYHNGKKQKILSKLTSHASNFFNSNKNEYINNKKFATFDARIYQVPNLEWACNQLLWRENDCKRNSIQSLGYYELGHSAIFNKNTDEVQELLYSKKGINWNDIESRFKRGIYIRRKTVSKKLTQDEIEKLPEKHNARKNPDMLITRNIIETVDTPIFQKIINREDFVFNGAEPIVKL